MLESLKGMYVTKLFYVIRLIHCNFAWRKVQLPMNVMEGLNLKTYSFVTVVISLCPRFVYQKKNEFLRQYIPQHVCSHKYNPALRFCSALLGGGRGAGAGVLYKYLQNNLERHRSTRVIIIIIIIVVT
jgi:hypothetical protein